MAEEEKKVAPVEGEAEGDASNVVEYAWCPEMGLTPDQVRFILKNDYINNNFKLADDDPEWILIAILNAFLEKEVKNNEKLLKAQTKFTETNIETFVGAVKTSSEEITTTLGNITVKNLQEVVKEFRGVLGAHTASMKFYSLINAILTAMNVTALGTLIFFVFKAVK